MDEMMVDSGYYISGMTIVYDITPFIAGPGIFYFRMEFLYLDPLGNEMIAECTILIEIFPENEEIYIEQVEYMFFYEYEWKELKWVCYLPAGYTEDNTRVLSFQINYSGDRWVGLGFDNGDVDRSVSYLIDGTSMWIYYPDLSVFHSRAFRMLIMQIAP